MKELIITQPYKSPVGELVLGSFQNKLVLCDWKYRKMRNAIDSRLKDNLKTEYLEGESTIIEKTIIQLDEYFKGERKSFDISIKLIGTDFQKSVWTELMNIPFGFTESYIGLARKLNNEKAIRAVSSANGANAVSIIVPCHRIIGSDKSLVGYAGGLTAKRKLLELENADKFPKQIKLF